MKLLSILAASIWAVTAAAQGITIAFPPEGENITPGQQLTIEVIKNEFIQATVEAGLVIGIEPCPMSDACSPTAAVGTILYNGPFNPQIDAEEHFSENFTVTIPSDIAKGPTQINFVRFFLFGLGNMPTFGGNNVTVTVV